MVSCAMLMEKQNYYFNFLGEELEHGEIATAKSNSIRTESLGEPSVLWFVAGTLQY